jgi:hypothetical protein
LKVVVLPFEFTSEVEERAGRRVAVIPPTTSERGLLEELAHRLAFPGWFGFNWNALLDSLRDLSWVPEEEVVIHHEAVPKLPVEELRTYLEILADTSSPVETDCRHRIRVSFAPEHEGIIRMIWES